MTERKIKIYLAAPLFSDAEIEFNVAVKKFLLDNCPDLEIFLPQMISYRDSQQVFEYCRDGVAVADIVLAIVDGADADSGTAWECGYAYAQATPIILLRTDRRRSGDSGGFNAMLLECATRVVCNSQNWKEELVMAIDQLVQSLNL